MVVFLRPLGLDLRDVAGRDSPVAAARTRPTRTDVSGARRKEESRVWTAIWTGRTYLYLEGGESVQIRCSFRPRDCDLTAEDMGVVWKGYWAVLEGCWTATHTRPLWFPG